MSRTPSPRAGRPCVSLALIVATLLAPNLPCCSSVPDDYESGLRRWRERTAVAERSGVPEHGAEAAHEVSSAHVARLDALPDLLAWAEREHPALRAAAERWRAALEQVRAVVSLPDPRLSLGWFRDPVETRVGPMDWRVAVSQALPRPGELDAAGRAAVARAEAAAADYEAARLLLRRSVRDAWVEAAWAAEALEITTAHRSLLEDWEQVARTRYATGLGGEQDVTRAQVELGTLDDRVRSLSDMAHPLRARLDAALGRPPGSPPLHPTLDALPVADFDEDALRAGLDTTNPRLLALQRRTAAASESARLADLQDWPDLAVGFDFTNIDRARMSGVDGSGQDALALTLSLGIPLRRDRRAADVARTLADASAAQAHWEDARLALGADLEQALFTARDAQRRIALYRDTLVPKGRESVQGSQFAYQSGEATFLDLIDAERVLIEFQLSAVRARADLAHAQASLEHLTGAPLPDGEE